jgi:SAM-dependent methyltransferase
MIDRSLNYGRHHFQRFLKSIGGFHRVLDVGAGQGYDLACAREVNPQAMLSGLEANPASAEMLRGKGIEVHRVDIEHDVFPFEDESFDVVMANQILEHTKELFWIFDQISRVLKKNGRLLIGVPNLAALHNRVLLAAGLQPSPLKNNSAHVRGFTKGDVLQFVESAFPGGYQLKGFGGSNFYPFPPLLARPLAALFPTLAWGIFFHFEKIKSYRGEFCQYPARMQLESNFFVGPKEELSVR